MPRPIARLRPDHAVLYAALAAVLLAAIAPLTGLYAQDEPAQPAEVQPDLQQDPQPPTLTEQLGGDDRYLTHLATDKPIYRTGETVYVRGTILHAFTNRPFDDRRAEIEQLDQQIQALEQGDADARNALWQRRAQIQQQANLAPMIEIKDAKGATITSGRARVEDSVFGFSWDVPDGQAGGEYTIKVTHPWSGLAPAERTFDIRAYRAPRIRSQIDFLKDGYGPGDTVIATLEATRAEGGVPEGAKVTAIARIDGVEVARVETTMPQQGMAQVRFDLPDTIDRGEGSLAFVIEDGGVVETASKTLPILLQTVDLQLFPEGGQLVANIENRVYFEAKTPYGKPADIKGAVYPIVPGVGVSDFAIGFFETTHEGRGVFRITPLPGMQHVVQITEPSSVTQTFTLPDIVQTGAVISTGPGVFQHNQPITIRVNMQDQPVKLLRVHQRERVVAESELAEIGQPTPRDGRAELTFRPISNEKLAELEAVIGAEVGTGLYLRENATGILTVTAYDADGNPLAERLIYRAPKDQVNITIEPDSAQYTPSGKVQLTIKTTDAQGNPVSAVAGVTVTDDAVLEMIETREQAPSLPAMVLLEPEVRDLADAHVYLDPNNPDAAEQLDLLLGTQGWRRFALVNLEDFIAEHGDDARRVLALRVPVQHEIRRMRRLAAQAGAVNDAPMPPGAIAFAEGAPEEAEADAFDDAGVDKAAPEPAAPPANEPVDLQAALEQAGQNQAGDALFEEDIAADRRRIAPQMVFVREYAHQQPAGKPFGERSDFTETVYWSAGTKTNDQGLATISFDLSDSVTSFRINTDAFTKDGAMGAGTTLIESVRPFYVEPKLPLELTAGDTVLLPIAVVNNTAEQLGVELLVSKLGQAGTTTLDPIALGSNTRQRTLHELVIGNTFGELAFNLEARVTSGGGNLFDTNKRSLRVVPKGFPIDDGSGGMLQPDGEASDTITIPDTIVPGSLTASVTVYPTPMANLTEALEALIRDPYGCFEQTSSTTFPLVMAQQYFLSHQGIDPQLIANAQEKLDKGYQRLIGFETEANGYEWFGATPPHEALTAYGLLQFNEMKQVMDVDQAMIDRTTHWLLSRCNDDGSFELDSKALDSFGRAPQDTTDSYIVWSLLEAGYGLVKIQKSVDLVLEKARGGEDAYIIALGANIAQLAAEQDDLLRDGQPSPYHAVAQQLRAKLASKLNDAGYVDGAVTSITRSGGDALNIETTSLAILAWLRDDAYTPQVEQAILWLTERCKQGRFGSTQSTVLALKAIVEYDKARSTPKAPGELILVVDGQPVGEPVAFDEETKGAIKLPTFGTLLTPGEHTVGVLMDGGSKMPYSIAINYFADTPASSPDCALRVITALDAEQDEQGVGVVQEGEIVEVRVDVINDRFEGVPMPIAIIGIPGGLEPRVDQLKELVDAGTIASFEIIGRDVVLYWRELEATQAVQLPISCVAAVPGTYTGPASRAYLYYTDEHKHWADGLAVQITPRD